MSSNNNSSPLLVFLSMLLLLILDFAFVTVSSSCLRKCGGIQIPYPFGIGEGCYLEKWYEIKCTKNIYNGKLVPFLSIIDKEVVNISLPGELYRDDPYGSVRIKNSITSKGCASGEEEPGSLLNLTGTPFYVGNSNSLMVVGCNNTSSLTNVEPSMVGCKSSCGTEYHTPSKDYLAVVSCNSWSYGYAYCSKRDIMNEKGCNGIGCCKADMPSSIQQIVGVRIDGNATTPGGCKVAFLTDVAYSLLNASDPKRFHAKGYATVVLGWYIHTTNLSFISSLGCRSAKEYVNLRQESYESIYAISCVCEFNSNFSNNYGSCSCNSGYSGNPYQEGCKDINECLIKDTRGDQYYCPGGTCVNVQGDYDCVYKNRRPLAIGLGSSFGSVIFIGGIYLLYKFVKKQRKLNQKKKFFKRNGGLLLQQQLTSTEGSIEKTRVFSSRELEKATENFSLNRILGQGGQGNACRW